MIATIINRKISIPSDTAYIVKAEGMVNDIGQELELSDEQTANVNVAVIEALKNAIVFGNQSNPEKEVSIVVDKKENELVFIISDSGNGFDFDSVPDPTSPENIEKISGRGVFLMRHLADDVVFENKGATVKLIFRY